MMKPRNEMNTSELALLNGDVQPVMRLNEKLQTSKHSKEGMSDKLLSTIKSDASNCSIDDMKDKSGNNNGEGVKDSEADIISSEKGDDEPFFLQNRRALMHH